MPLKSVVQTGTQRRPPRIVLHGIHGVGKSTFGAQAPNPIFLQTEDGLNEIDVPKFPLATDLQQVWDYMALLVTEEHEYKTFVLDTADWLEKLIWADVCENAGVKNITDIDWGRGYHAAITQWEKFYRGVEKLRDNGMAILILAHNEIKLFHSPDQDSYDRYQIKLNHMAASRMEEWADVVLFANYKIYVDSKKQKAIGSAERIIHTTSRPAWRTKTRYALPDELPLDFNVLLEHIKTSKPSINQAQPTSNQATQTQEEQNG